MAHTNSIIEISFFNSSYKKFMVNLLMMGYNWRPDIISRRGYKIVAQSDPTVAA